MKDNTLPSPEEIGNKIKEHISAREFRVAIVLLVSGVLCYIPFMTTRILSPDLNKQGLIYYPAHFYDWNDFCGRYLERYYAKIKSWFMFQWAETAMYLVWIILAALLIFSMLKIRSYFGMLVGGWFLLFSPSFIECLFSLFDDFLFSFFLSVLAVFLLHKKYSPARVLFSVICLASSLAFYQAYFFTAILLFVFVFIRDMMDETSVLRETLKKTGIWILTTILSILCYFLLNKFLIKIGIIVYSGNRFENNYSFSLSAILQGILNCFPATWKLFFTSATFNYRWRGMYLFNAALFLIGLIVLLFTLPSIKKRGISYLCWTLVACLALPIAICGVTILFPNDMKQIILPTGTLFYLGVLALIENQSHRISSVLVKNLMGWGTILISLYLVINFGVYLCIYQTMGIYKNEQFASVAQQIVTRIEDQYPDAQKGDGAWLMVCGGVDEAYPMPQALIEASYILTGTTITSGVTFDDMSFYVDVWPNYYNYTMGRNFRSIGAEMGEEIYNSDEYKAMDIFPGKNSIIMTDNQVIVVKLKN